MNAKRGALLASVLCTALIGAGCDRPNDTIAQRGGMEPPSKMSPSSPSTQIPAVPPVAAGDRAPSGAPSATDKAAAAMDDTALTAKVKAALIAEPGLKAMPIDVSTKNSVVTLSGEVQSAVERAKALQVAENVQGVKSVVDNLTAKS